VTREYRRPEKLRSALARVKQRAPRLHGWARRATSALLRQVRQLKNHRRRWVRLAAGFALILGGVFAFLPVLGIWMLPLGVVILSNETSYLRRPRRRLQVWLGRRYPGLRHLIDDDEAPETADRNARY
jgi:hypothetical protein